MSELTVIVPTFNCRQSVDDLVQSLRAQTYKNFKLLIIDNGTSNASKELLRKIDYTDLEYEIIFAEENLGPGGGRNKAFEKVDTKYIAFTDDDCVPDHDWLESIMNTFKSSNVRVMYGAVYSIVKPDPPFIHAFELDGNHFGAGNCAFESDLFREIGGFDLNMNTWAEDYEIYNRVLSMGEEVRFVPEMKVDHPPRYQKYSFLGQIYDKVFLDKYEYLHFVRGFKEKENLFLGLLKKSIVFSSIIIVPAILLCLFTGLKWGAVIGVLFLVFFSFRKVARLKKALEVMGEKESFSFINFLTYSMTYWLIPIINFFIFLKFKISMKMKY